MTGFNIFLRCHHWKLFPESKMVLEDCGSSLSVRVNMGMLGDSLAYLGCEADPDLPSVKSCL